MKTNINMAREAGFMLVAEPNIDGSDWYECFTEEIESFAELVRADEREAIYNQWHSCVMADLENGVKWLNEKAAADWHKNYPAQSNLFPAWIEARGNT